jgi:ABC-type transport system involved in multi-copper enzyme maturation permease subunit
VNVRLTQHLFGRLIRGRRLIGMIALASVGGIVSIMSLLGASEGEGLDAFHEIMVTVPAATLSIACLFLGTAVLRDERDGGTLPFLFISPVSRFSFAVSAWLAAMAASVLVAVAGWIPVALATTFMADAPSAAAPALALYVAAAIAYSAVFVPLGYLFARSLLVGLAYVFVWEGILASAVSGLSASSIWRTSLSIYADLETLERDVLEVIILTPGAGGGIVKVAVVVALGIAILSWAIRRRDAV